MADHPHVDTYVDRIAGHRSFDGGHIRGDAYDLLCLWARIPGTEVWVIVGQSPTPPDRGGGLPIPVRRAA